MPPNEPESADPAGPEPRPAEDDTQSFAVPDLSGDAEATPADEEPPAETAPAVTVPTPDDPERAARVRKLVVIAVVAVLLLAGTVLLAIVNHAARSNGPLANQAWVDEAATQEVVAQLTAAVKTVYSYDYRTLDKNEADAKAVITGAYADEFDKVFAPVKQLAPKEQAVLGTTVAAAGVLQLHDDQARVLMMVDQDGTRMNNQPIAGTKARLVVAGQRVDGKWKISEVTPE
jgi:Mce-associated membrane protein